MVSVSASMIVRNEAAGLAAALRSLARLDAIDEVVVLDTGSTDRTIEIARGFGAKVFEQPWQDDFAFHRNHCLELCKNDWVFILDGDEDLRDPGDLDAFFAAPSTDGAAVTVQTQGVDGQGETFVSVRAFDKQQARWKYPVHNQLVGLSRAATVNATIIAHYDEATADATQRRLQVLLDAEREAPSDPHFAYFITKGYRLLQDFDKVIEWGDRFFDVADASVRGASVSTWMVEAHLALGDMKHARELLRLALGRFPGFADLHFLELAFAARDWFASVHAPNNPFRVIPSMTASRTDKLPELSRLLNLPFQFNLPGQRPFTAEES